MPWIRFTDRFMYTLRFRRGKPTTVYPQGMVAYVTRDRAAAAIAAGKAEPTESPRKRKYAYREDA